MSLPNRKRVHKNILSSEAGDKKLIPVLVHQYVFEHRGNLQPALFVDCGESTAAQIVFPFCSHVVPKLTEELLLRPFWTFFFLATVWTLFGGLSSTLGERLPYTVTSEIVAKKAKIF